jgi:hypothetical protein
MSVDVKKVSNIYFTTLFLTRRLIYAIFVVFIKITIIQIIVTTLFSFVILAYLASNRPFQDK